MGAETRQSGCPACTVGGMGERGGVSGDGGGGDSEMGVLAERTNDWIPLHKRNAA